MLGRNRVLVKQAETWNWEGQAGDEDANGYGAAGVGKMRLMLGRNRGLGKQAETLKGGRGRG